MHVIQTRIKGPQINQGRLEAPPTTNGHVYALTKSDVETRLSTVMTGQILVAIQYVNV